MFLKNNVPSNKIGHLGEFSIPDEQDGTYVYVHILCLKRMKSEIL